MCIYNIEILNLFNPKLKLINTKPVIKNNLRDFELNKLKVQTILLLENKNINNHKSMREMFQSSAKLIINDSDIGKVFGSMHESVTTNIKNSVSKDRIFKTIV